MQALIKFRSLASQLNNEELKQAIQEWIQSCDNQQILSSLFNHFHHQYLNNGMQNDNQLENITNIISVIIQSRQEEEEEEEEKQANSAPDPIITKPRITKMSQLSSHWIGQIASYLPVRDYVNFSMTDRMNYVACYSPSTLQKMTYPTTANTRCNLSVLFASLKCIDFIEPIIQNHPYPIKFRALNELQLSLWMNTEQAELFLNNPCFNFSNIQKLKVWSSKLDLLLKLLQKCPNVRHLCIKYIDPRGASVEIKESEIAKLVPKLKSIYATHALNHNVMNLINKFIKTHNIESLAVALCDDIIPLSLPAMHLNHLKEIMFFDPTIKQLKHVICAANGLQRISFYFEAKERFKDPDLQNIFVSLISGKCKELEFIHFNAETAEHLATISQYIEIGALKAQQMRVKRKKFVIEVDAENIPVLKVDLYIWRIVRCLESLAIDNFMLKYYFYYDDEDKVDIEAAHKLVETFSSNYSTFVGKVFAENDESHSVMIISNKNCTINGFKENWINKSYQWGDW